MRINNLTQPIIVLGCMCLFSSCGRQILPVPDSSKKLSASISDGSGRSFEGTNSSNSSDDEYFLALRKAEIQLRKIVELHKIPEPKSNPELSGADPKTLIFIHIDAVRNELLRLKNQPIQKTSPQPKSNQEQKLRTEINDLTNKIGAQSEEIRSLNEQIRQLTDQIAKSVKTPLLTPAPPPAPPEVVHTCKVQLKKSKKFVKDIQVKGDVITFNFKFSQEDIKTQHPQNSYSLENSKESTYLIITNSKYFWSISNDLIVWGTKEYHGCLDKDYRKN